MQPTTTDWILISLLLIRVGLCGKGILPEEAVLPCQGELWCYGATKV
uniref:Uncharacterized protein n=1 Tax=Setaria viridis TaxID=4556 RepID=A0A4U6UKP2_SETVI|nr:hypothetical protein SEVIR_5G234540v2 [Setaria viridis]